MICIIINDLDFCCLHLKKNKCLLIVDCRINISVLVHCLDVPLQKVVCVTFRKEHFSKCKTTQMTFINYLLYYSF